MSPKLLTGEDVNLTLRDLTQPLIRRKRVWMPMFLCVFAVAALIGLLQPLTYESHMSILITREGPPPAKATEVDAPTPPPTDQEVTSEAESLKSQEFLERVVLSNGLQNGQDSRFLSFLFPRQTETVRLAHAVRQLDGQVQIHTRLSAHLIEVTYRSTGPAQAYGVLNSLGNLYLAQHALRPAPASSPTSAPQSQGYKVAMEDAESGLREFQRTQSRSDTGRDLARQLTAAVGQSRAIEHAIAAGEQKIRTDQEQMQEQMQGSPQQPVPQQDNETTNLLLQNLGARLHAAETKRAQFLQKFAPNYALVQDANKEVSEAKAGIAAAQKSSQGKQTPAHLPDPAVMRERLAQDQADLAARRASFSAVRRALEEMKAQMLKSGGNAVNDADLEREVKADERSYLQYLSRREQERTAGALDQPPAVGAASVTQPTMPASPVRGRGVVFLVALGLAAAVSFPAALILDSFDPCFHTPTQVIETLGIPVVLAVPKMTA